MGQASAWPADVDLEDVRVPAETITGGVEGHGFAAAMKSFDRGRIDVGSVCLGQARRILTRRHALRPSARNSASRSGNSN